jgi:hypothetical protein
MATASKILSEESTSVDIGRIEAAIGERPGQGIPFAYSIQAHIC